MAISSTIRSIGKTTAVSVGASATSEVLITSSTNDQNTFVSLINTGATSVAVKFGPTVERSCFARKRLHNWRFCSAAEHEQRHHF